MPWRQVTSRRLIGLLKWPIIAGLATMVILYFFTWVKMLGAVMAFGFCVFSLTAIMLEYWRGVRARHKAHGESYGQAISRLTARNRRRYGGYLIHFGVILGAVGIIGMEFYQVETQQNVARGESFTISSPFAGTYELTYLNLASGEKPNPNIDIIEAHLEVKRNGKPIGEIVPYREFFILQQQPMTIPDTKLGLGDELYIIIAGWEGTGETATFTTYINPLINWLWFGGFVMMLGTFVAAWPQPERAPRTRSATVDRRFAVAK